MDAVEIGLKLALDEYIKNIGFDPVTHSRKHECVSARQGFMAAAKTHTSAMLKVIGRLFHRDHTTVLHAINVVNEASELNDSKSVALIHNYKLAKKSIIKYKNSTEKVVVDNVEIIRLKNKISILESVITEKDDKIDEMKSRESVQRAQFKRKEREIERLESELSDVRSSKEDYEYHRLRKLAKVAGKKKLIDNFNGY